ncbi:hypothetical protein SAMN05421753_12071 [Planctomicrobium piriforme]|uniref:Uncharacterized protein n=1 Tax=Planctomicrobium piriforme TaxID=1576369 RepID=A0A1I3RDL1_9PLAN|nr:hypothetical protein SAMN05421753_12071 [Planctomicrobium piriforme]
MHRFLKIASPRFGVSVAEKFDSGYGAKGGAIGNVLAGRTP